MLAIAGCTDDRAQWPGMLALAILVLPVGFPLPAIHHRRCARQTTLSDERATIADRKAWAGFARPAAAVKTARAGGSVFFVPAGD
jgi:hypothetical protein